MAEEIRVRENKEIGMVRGMGELKERVIELEAEKAKREGVVREKEKQIVNVTKQMAQEGEDRRKELQKRDAELKAVQEELREVSRRERTKFDDLTLQN